MEFLRNLDWSPLFISLKTGVVATIICFFIGTGMAYYVMKLKGMVGVVLDGLFTLPMVLPPTVAGFLLLFIFGLRRPVGGLLYRSMGLQVVQTWLGCILAAVVIALPLMYRNARAAFELINPELIQVARTLGLSEQRIFWKIVLPVAKPGLLSGTILTFTRALGEYGATAMLAGNIPGKTGTISQRIALVLQNGDYRDAGIWTGIVVLIAMLCIFGMNLFSRNNKKW